MTRTSISLPQIQMDILKKAARVLRLSKAQIALACLKRMQKNAAKMKLVKRDTIEYNQSACSAKLYLLLSPEEHNYVQALRIVEKVSVSYLIVIAIIGFLSKLLEVHYSKRFQKRYMAKVNTIFANIQRELLVSSRRSHTEMPVSSRSPGRIEMPVSSRRSHIEMRVKKKSSASFKVTFRGS